ncbi:hypothetical protein [Bradyrhizobium phage BDU-MI-1]|nr:hypothetical protein [Bradyrhizobium phage BDU-MI-1]
MNIIAQAVSEALQRHDSFEKAKVDRIAELEAQGVRLVKVGSETDPYAVIDYRTQEILLADFDMEWGASWSNIDRVIDDVLDAEEEKEFPDPFPSDIPDGLGIELFQCIEDWVFQNQDLARVWLAAQAA